MRLRYACPGCDAQREVDVSPPGEVRCDCGWSREVKVESFSGDTPTQCVVCGCDDLWRQKDFPQALGLFLLAIQIILSTIAWQMYMPLVTYGIMMGFALADGILFALMKDMLVCYRCRARHRKTSIAEDHPNFDLEVAERYRQQQLRMGDKPPSA